MLNNNRETGKRAQVMQAPRPKDGIAFDNTRQLQLNQEPVTVKAAFITQLGEDEGEVPKATP